ncbi:Mu transposase C-terminal domain-containing protein [Thiobacillus sedimenti]|uniref:Mu transposase C-terminal domain-containing protein n=1 Tax=Thiobacillus sedimenti TaxID=3110231 RepID=A0ABZ1CMH9_9PROT|nr:Mu transposase C-terminal domain-containing protein [Thiobacillus sp. SCUT-2]WRS40604.1 Mu transposase C-terminal domain-containing protein [Thiobacillus sp. SCUT-2]
MNCLKIRGLLVTTKTPVQVSYEFVRQNLQGVDKFEQKLRLLGALHAIQDERQIGRLHTYYPGQRTELDYTKYGVWLFPNENWNEPLFYYTGTGIDHASKAIKGFTITVDPSARDAVRLYRNCVLPKALWLPPSLHHHAQGWDVFGIEVYVAVDNATDLTANAIILMFFINGVIVLRMPPRRGDLKGTVERTQQTIETRVVSSMPGYVSKKYTGLDPRYKKIRDRAKAKANMTVADFQARLVEGIQEHNHARHPDFKKPRIQVWRDGQEQAPLVLPTGRLQLRTTFALTYEATLTREGVQAETLMFNSPELHAVYRVHTGEKVHVKVDPDDVRSVLVFVPQLNEPVEAFLSTFDLDFPMSLELIRVVLKRLEERYTGNEVWREEIGFHLLDELQRVQSGPMTRTPGKTKRSDAQAATHAVALPTVTPQQVHTSTNVSLSDLLKGSKI